MRKYWLVGLVLAACSAPAATPDASPDAAVVPVFRNPVALDDATLAQQALQTLGLGSATTTGCNYCHGLTRQRIRYWRALSDAAMSSCLTDLEITDEVSAREMIDCTRSMAGVDTSDFAPHRLGIYSTATHLPWFQFAFWRAYGDAGATELARLQQQAGMPKGDGATALTQEQFDVVAEWFARGVPGLDASLPSDPPPSSCTPGISAAVATHVTAMATAGWSAINRTNMMAMHGCGSATDPRDCLTDEPLAADQTYGAGWDVAGRGTWRVLLDVTYASQYWTRASPDGRFVSHGVSNVTGSYVQDLAREVAVPITGEYDPAFFPDNAGFSFQGELANTCAMSVLTSNPSTVTMTESGCTRIITLGQYQHMSRALDGGDYFSADSQFVNDDGGKTPTLVDPDASFTADSTMNITPMIFDGTRFVAKARVRIATPFEGDVVMSPSAKIAITRVAGPDDTQLGMVLRAIEATPVGTGYTITAPEIGRYCVSGGKPELSFDERWAVYHHYIGDADASELGFTGPSDPAFAPYQALGAANLYLLDLVTGESLRITNMAAGQYALFPHFRSDGWIYAQVRDAASGHEYTVASDAALLQP